MAKPAQDDITRIRMNAQRFQRAGML